MKTNNELTKEQEKLITNLKKENKKLRTQKEL